MATDTLDASVDVSPSDIISLKPLQEQLKVQESPARALPSIRLTGLRVDAPPSSEAALASWEARLPSFPACDWPVEDEPKFKRIGEAYNALSPGYKYTWSNPIRDIFGPNPFEWENAPDYEVPSNPMDPNDDKRTVYRGLADPVFDSLSLPPVTLLEVPRLDVADLPKLSPGQSEPKFLYQGERVWVFHAATVSGDRLLKVYDSTDMGWDKFELERNAYAHFLTAGPSVLQYVPAVFGWFDMSQALMQDADPDWLDFFNSFRFSQDETVHVLMTEYIVGDELSTRTVTVPAATKALRALAAVHSTGILHNDALGRHFLLCADGRVVIIDFDAAWIFPDPDVDLLRLWREMKRLWEMLFQDMLPDKMVGIDRDWVWF